MSVGDLVLIHNLYFFLTFFLDGRVLFKKMFVYLRV